jgi:ACS family hexuronate transporter-like MFS transporter
MNSATSGPDSAPPLSAGAGRYRWVICGLLFAATAVNYIDRQMIGVLKPTLQAEFGWNENAYSTIILWFQLAYALGYLSFGKIVDQIGARAAIAIVIWTIGHVAHGFAGASPPLPPRALGWAWAIGQFPRRYPRRGRLVPAKERALAIGIFNAGANVGAIITPLLVPALVLWFGWRTAFFVTGIFGVAWLAAWWALYRHPSLHPHVKRGELDWIVRTPRYRHQDRLGPAADQA